MTAAGAVLNLTTPASFPPAGSDKGTIPVFLSATIPTTATDHADDSILIAGPLPPVAFIKNGAGVFVARWDDLDSSTGLDFDLGFGGIDGVLDFTMINVGTTDSQKAFVGQSAQVALSDPWLDIGGLYVIMEIIAAATTSVAGVIEIGFDYTQNVLKHDVAT